MDGPSLSFFPNSLIVQHQAPFLLDDLLMNQGMVCCRTGLMMHLKIEGKIRVKIEGGIFSVKIGPSMNHTFWVTVFNFFCISSVFISRIHNVRDKTSLSLVKYFC